METNKTSINIAVWCALGAAFTFSIMFGLIKMLGSGYPAGETLFCRSFFALLPLLPLVAHQGGMEVFKTRHPWHHVLRSTIGLISAFWCIESLKLLPLSEATSIFYSAPLITTVVAIPLLKEKVSFAKVLAVITGFFGVIVILNPHANSNFWGFLMALGSAVFSSLVAIELRKMGQTEKSITIVVYFMLACSLAGLLTMPFHFVMPDAHDAWILLGVGVIGGLAQICMTEAYHRAPASMVAPLGYTSLIWAAIIDMLMFDKVPTLTTCLGALLIAGSGVFVVTMGNRQKVEMTAVKNNQVSVAGKV